MAKNRTPKGMVAIRTHDGDVTKSYICSGSFKRER